MAGPIQIVFVKWGTKYSTAYVNGLVEAIARHTKSPLRFVCLTEDVSGLDPRVRAVPFPDLGLPLKALTGRGGSLPKLGMFQKGVLQEGLPTLYIDLDTSILGDVQRMEACLERKRGLYILQRHWVPYWRFSRLVRRFAPERYYLGNTAIMAFYPEDWAFMAERFAQEYPRIHREHATVGKPMPKDYAGGNEYLISAWGGHDVRVFPRDVAIKFTQEYMAPLGVLAQINNHLPWVRARRARQVALTFHGEPLKPKYLALKTEGEPLRFKHHHTVWHYPEISAYWRPIIAASEAVQVRMPASLPETGGADAARPEAALA